MSVWHNKLLSDCLAWLRTPVYAVGENGERIELRMDLQLFAADDTFDVKQEVKKTPAELKDERALEDLRKKIVHELSTEKDVFGVREKRLLEVLGYPAAFTIKVPQVPYNVIAGPNDFKVKPLMDISVEDMVQLSRRYVNNIGRFLSDSNIKEQYKYYFSYLFANHPLKIIRYAHNGEIFILPSLQDRVEAAVAKLGKNSIAAQQLESLWVGYDTFEYENIDTIQIFHEKEEELLGLLNKGNRRDPLGYTERTLLNALGLNRETAPQIRKLIHERKKIKYEYQRFEDLKKLLDQDYGGEESRLAKELGCTVKAIEAVKYLLLNNGVKFFIYEDRGEMYIVLNNPTALSGLKDELHRQRKDKNDVNQRRIMDVIDWLKLKNDEEHEEILAAGRKMAALEEAKQKQRETEMRGKRESETRPVPVIPPKKVSSPKAEVPQRKQYVPVEFPPRKSFEQICEEVDRKHDALKRAAITAEQQIKDDIFSLCYETKKTWDECSSAYERSGNSIGRARKILLLGRPLNEKEEDILWRSELLRSYSKEVRELTLLREVMMAGFDKDQCKSVLEENGGNFEVAKKELLRKAAEINEKHAQELKDMFG